MASEDKSAKERLAQLQKGQDKNGAPKGPGKLNVASKFGPTAAEKNKPTTPSKEPEKPKVEPTKPKEEAKKVPEVKGKPEPKKMDAEKPKTDPPKSADSKPADPAKPKEEPKPAPAPTATKPAEQPKPAAAPTAVAAPAPAPAAAKPLEQPKPAAAPTSASATAPAAAPGPLAKPTEQPKVTAAPAPAVAAPAAAPAPAAAAAAAPAPAAAPAAAKPAEQSKPAAAALATAPAPAAAAKPVEQPRPVAAPAPAAVPVPKPTTAPASTVAPVAVSAASVARGPGEDFFTNIFYFSGMGSLIGSALAEGVYVPEKNQRSALDAEEMEAAKERAKAKTEEIIVTARTQAQGLSTDFRQLQSLLDTLPTFTDTLAPQPLDKRGIDQPIHGHRYFHQTERSHSRQGAVHQDGSAYESRKTPVGGASVLPGAYPPNDADLYYQQQQQQLQQQRERQRQEEELARRRQQEAEQRAAALSASANQSSRRSPAPPSRSSYQNENGFGGPDYGGRGAGGHDGHGAPGGADGYGGRAGGAGRVSTDPAAAQQAWQDKYSLGEGGRPRQPTPRRQDESYGEIRDAGDVDTAGIKPWQLSHIRSLEAKGYHIIDHEGEPTGSNWSYAPYLVSDRSKNIDLQQRGGSVGRYQNSPSPAPHQFQARGGQPYRPPTQPSYGGGYTSANDTSLPYCDL